MSSILTNTSAMVALQTMKGINANLNRVQNEISTGKSIATARDNAAVWAISKVMESDVSGFKGIAESLSLGSSTIAVAREAAESVTELLKGMKAKIVSAQQQNMDRSKLQTDIDQAIEQIGLVINGAQFSGLNMVQGTEAVQVLASLDRDGAGNVTASHISVARNDLTSAAGTYGTGAALNANAVVSSIAAGALNDDGNNAVVTLTNGADYSTGTLSLTIGNNTLNFAAGELGAGNQDAAAAIVAGRINALGMEGVTANVTGAAVTINSTRSFATVGVTVAGLGGASAGTQITNLNGTAVTVLTGEIAERAENVTFSTVAAVNDGDGYRITVGTNQFTYVAGKGQTMEDVAKGLKAAIDKEGLEGITTRVTQNASGAWKLMIDNATTTPLTVAAVGAAGGEASGGLFGLDGISVLTDDSAAAALSNIEHLINRAIDASSAFGSAQSRIDIQADFVGKLSDALTAGIGTLVDADMEEASARLQALQVQQQLGIQALSIANQQPQNLLALFR